MIQKTYHFQDVTGLEAIIKEVLEDENYQSASSVLIQLYNSRLDMDEERMVKRVNEAIPKACVTGITAAVMTTELIDANHFSVELSVTFLKNAKLTRYEFDLDEQSAFSAGRMMSEYLEDMEQVKCLQIFYSANSTGLNMFLREFSHHKLPKFGIKAGYNLAQHNRPNAYGSKVYQNAIVVVAFTCKCLRLYMDNNLGWQPIGIEMAITGMDGDNVIANIDQKPAIEMYSKYLDVSPNKYFVENVCEFPLIIDRGGFQIARVPTGYGRKGEIKLHSNARKGEHFRMAYADREKILALTRRSAEELERFQPEAVFLFECTNRMLYFGKDLNIETQRYRRSHNELSAVFGFSELFITAEGAGGDLNSSLVVIGLREDDEGDDEIVLTRNIESYDKCTIGQNRISYVDRILTFFERTSKELDSMNRELGKIAYTDQLTKIFNRWELEKKLDEDLLLNKQGTRYGVLFLDIDHFKQVNDTYGHDVGDYVLRNLVDVVREYATDGHALGRWGGEEFIYLVPCADKDELYAFAEDIRQSVEKERFGEAGHITISIGATMARADDDRASVVKRADDALYEAKNTGRNKVVIKE
ncbi:MAG: GGDEF domain-containing protein [Eubacterium sp.]|nr:GGDEF domain-containing protein [Eubacterium sp.]